MVNSPLNLSMNSSSNLRVVKKLRKLSTCSFNKEFIISLSRCVKFSFSYDKRTVDSILFSTVIVFTIPLLEIAFSLFLVVIFIFMSLIFSLNSRNWSKLMNFTSMHIPS